uniref:hypothetical protein n=1 Tax=Streptomyces cynarae TaxID=2981134 RepID=UPI0036F3D9BA
MISERRNSMITETCARLVARGSPRRLSARALRLLARRIQHLTEEINDLTARITSAIAVCAPRLLDRYGVGPDTAAALLIAAGDNPDRMGSEASFAAL